MYHAGLCTMHRFGGGQKSKSGSTHVAAREELSRLILAKRCALEGGPNLILLARFIARIVSFEETNQREISLLSMAACCFARDAITGVAPSWEAAPAASP
jgi:hypothetical protein